MARAGKKPSVDQLAALFGILSDRTRLRIVEMLSRECCSVSAIVEATGRSQPLISHHLRILRESGLAATERKGALTFY